MIRFEHLTLRQMMNDEVYHSLSDDLVQLPVPDRIRIGKKYFDVPETMEKFAESICYGQRLFLTEKESNDFGVIIRMTDGYFYPVITGNQWDDDEALKFGRLILDCTVKDIYPVANHLVKLLDELLKRERILLHREPTSQEKAAGIDKLSKFAELSAIKYLQTSLGKSREQVLLTAYNECLVEFMLAKEQNDFNERLTEVYKREVKK